MNIETCVTVNEIKSIPNLDITKQHRLDYFTGVTGTVAIMTNIYEKVEDPIIAPKLLQLMSTGVHYIRDNIEKFHKRDTRIGLSHGYSGILIALSRFDRVTGSNKNKELILKLIDLEENYYRLEKNNYLDLRDNTDTKNYMCYGLVGILLARIELYENGYTYLKKGIVSKGKKLADDIITGALSFDGYSYSLCHGIGGFIELFQELERTGLTNGLVHEELYDILFKKMINRKNGVNSTLKYDSFMLGNGGASYNLMKQHVYMPSFLMLKSFTNSTIAN